MQALIDARDFEKANLLQDATNAMCVSLEVKKEYQTYVSKLSRLVKYANRDDIDDDTRRRKDAVMSIYRELQKKRKHTDNTDLMVQINGKIKAKISELDHWTGKQETKAAADDLIRDSKNCWLPG